MCFSEKASGFLFQKIATGIGCLLCLNYGVLFGITSSNIIFYQSAASPLIKTIDSEAATFLGAYVCLGGLIGSLIFGYASDKVGPRSILLLCGLLQIGCWFCILFAYNIDHIYWSRIAGGLAAGGAFAVLPVYIKDISEEKNERFLQSFVDFSQKLGIFIGFLVAFRTSFYAYLPIIGLGMSFIFTMFFPFMPESPYYYLRTGEKVMMEKSLRWFRGIRNINDRNKPEFLDEIKKFNENRKNVTNGEITNKKISFTLLIFSTLVLVSVSQFCGIFVVLNYSETIFKNLHSSIQAESGLILSGAQFVGSLINIRVKEKVGFKTLASVTSMFSGILLIVMAALITFNFLVNFLTLQQMNWIYLSILAAYLLIANIGFYSLTYFIISDISTEEIKPKSTTLSMSFMWFLAMMILKFYFVLIDSIGFAGLLWIFGGTCLLNFFFTLWM